MDFGILSIGLLAFDLAALAIYHDTIARISPRAVGANEYFVFPFHIQIGRRLVAH